MPLVAEDLATAMATGLGQMPPVPQQMRDFAQNLIDAVEATTISNPPGTITAVASPSGGPIVPGTGATVTPGILNTAATTLGPDLEASLSEMTAEITGLANAITTHIGTGGAIFPPGTITGTTTNTTSSPGTFTGEGNNGILAFQTGAILATAVQVANGYPNVTPQLIGMCNAIVAYFTANAQAAYPTGSVVGVAPPGGPITGGAGTGGTIS